MKKKYDLQNAIVSNPQFYSSFHKFRPHADICISSFLCAYPAGSACGMRLWVRYKNVVHLAENCCNYELRITNYELCAQFYT